VRTIDAFTKNAVSNGIQIKIVSYFFLFLFYLAFPPPIFTVGVYTQRREEESDLRDIKFEYLVLILLNLVNMLVEALETVLSFEQFGLVTVRIRASPNLGRGVLVGMVLMIVEKSKTGRKESHPGFKWCTHLAPQEKLCIPFSNVGIGSWC
jgi:hypothetical protein